MTWDAWCQTYPCNHVDEVPDGFEPFGDRVEAERARDNFEMEEERAFCVVQCGEMFYVGPKI